MDADSQQESLDDKISSKAMPGPLSQELAEWSREFRTRWFRDHEKFAWSRGGRLMVAAFGALVYLSFAVWTAAQKDKTIASFLDSNRLETYGILTVTLAATSVIIVAVMLGSFVVSQDDDAGPVRALLGGIALPAVVLLIVKFSLWIF